MLKTEVTASQHARCVDAGVCDEPYAGTELYNWGKPNRENHPVNAAEWSDAKAFAEWMGAWLPSEAQWEYAARSGGQDIVHPWGDEEVTVEHAVISYDVNDNDCGNETTMEVCSTALGNTARGLCVVLDS